MYNFNKNAPADAPAQEPMPAEQYQTNANDNYNYQDDVINNDTNNNHYAASATTPAPEASAVDGNTANPYHVNTESNTPVNTTATAAAPAAYGHNYYQSSASANSYGGGSGGAGGGAGGASAASRGGHNYYRASTAAGSGGGDIGDANAASRRNLSNNYYANAAGLTPAEVEAQRLQEEQQARAAKKKKPRSRREEWVMSLFRPPPLPGQEEEAAEAEAPVQVSTASARQEAEAAGYNYYRAKLQQQPTGDKEDHEEDAEDKKGDAATRVIKYHRKFLQNFVAAPPKPWRRLRMLLPSTMIDLQVSAAEPFAPPSATATAAVTTAAESNDLQQKQHKRQRKDKKSRRNGSPSAAAAQQQQQQQQPEAPADASALSGMSPTVVMVVEGRVPDETTEEEYIYQMAAYIVDLLDYLDSPVALTEMRVVRRVGGALCQLAYTFANSIEVARQVLLAVEKQGIEAFFGPPLPPPPPEDPEDVAAGRRRPYAGESFPAPVATFLVEDFLRNAHASGNDNGGSGDNDNEDGENNNDNNGDSGGGGITEADMETLLGPFVSTRPDKPAAKRHTGPPPPAAPRGHNFYAPAPDEQQEDDEEAKRKKAPEGPAVSERDVHVISGPRDGLFYVAVKRPETVFTVLWTPFASVRVQRDLFKRFGVLLTMASEARHEFLPRQSRHQQQHRERQLQYDAHGNVIGVAYVTTVGGGDAGGSAQGGGSQMVHVSDDESDTDSSDSSGSSGSDDDITNNNNNNASARHGDDGGLSEDPLLYDVDRYEREMARRRRQRQSRAEPKVDLFSAVLVGSAEKGERKKGSTGEEPLFNSDDDDGGGERDGRTRRNVIEGDDILDEIIPDDDDAAEDEEKQQKPLVQQPQGTIIVTTDPAGYPLGGNNVDGSGYYGNVPPQYMAPNLNGPGFWGQGGADAYSYPYYYNNNNNNNYDGGVVSGGYGTGGANLPYDAPAVTAATANKKKTEELDIIVSDDDDDNGNGGGENEERSGGNKNYENNMGNNYNYYYSGMAPPRNSNNGNYNYSAGQPYGGMSNNNIRYPQPSRGGTNLYDQQSGYSSQPPPGQEQNNYYSGGGSGSNNFYASGNTAPYSAADNFNQHAPQSVPWGGNNYYGGGGGIIGHSAPATAASEVAPLVPAVVPGTEYAGSAAVAATTATAAAAAASLNALPGTAEKLKQVVDTIEQRLRAAFPRLDGTETAVHGNAPSQGRSAFDEFAYYTSDAARCGAAVDSEAQKVNKLVFPLPRSSRVRGVLAYLKKPETLHWVTQLLTFRPEDLPEEGALYNNNNNNNNNNNTSREETVNTLLALRKRLFLLLTRSGEDDSSAGAPTLWEWEAEGGEEGGHHLPCLLPYLLGITDSTFASGGNKKSAQCSSASPGNGGDAGIVIKLDLEGLGGSHVSGTDGTRGNGESGDHNGAVDDYDDDDEAMDPTTAAASTGMSHLNSHAGEKRLLSALVDYCVVAAASEQAQASGAHESTAGACQAFSRLLSRYLLFFIAPKRYFSKLSGGKSANEQRSDNDNEEEEEEKEESVADSATRHFFFSNLLLPLLHCDPSAENPVVACLVKEWPALCGWMAAVISGRCSGGGGEVRNGSGAANGSEKATTAAQRQLLTSMLREFETLFEALSPAQRQLCRRHSQALRLPQLLFNSAASPLLLSGSASPPPSGNHSSGTEAVRRRCLEAFWSPAGAAARGTVRLLISAGTVEVDSLLPLLFACDLHGGNSGGDDNEDACLPVHEKHYNDYYFFVLSVAAQSKSSMGNSMSNTPMSYGPAKLCGFFLRWMEVFDRRRNSMPRNNNNNNNRNNSSDASVGFEEGERVQLARTVVSDLASPALAQTILSYYCCDSATGAERSGSQGGEGGLSSAAAASLQATLAGFQAGSASSSSESPEAASVLATLQAAVNGSGSSGLPQLPFAPSNRGGGILSSAGGDGSVSTAGASNYYAQSLQQPGSVGGILSGDAASTANNFGVPLVSTGSVFGSAPQLPPVSSSLSDPSVPKRTSILGSDTIATGNNNSHSNISNSGSSSNAIPGVGLLPGPAAAPILGHYPAPPPPSLYPAPPPLAYPPYPSQQPYGSILTAPQPAVLAGPMMADEWVAPPSASVALSSLSPYNVNPTAPGSGNNNNLTTRTQDEANDASVKPSAEEEAVSPTHSALYHKWKKAYTTALATYGSGEPFTPLPPGWTASISRSYGHYYFKRQPGTDAPAEKPQVTYRHPTDLIPFMVSPQAFLREHFSIYSTGPSGEGKANRKEGEEEVEEMQEEEKEVRDASKRNESFPRSLRQFVSYVNHVLIAGENELVARLSSPAAASAGDNNSSGGSNAAPTIPAVTMQEAREWLSRQNSRHLFFDVATLDLLKITYKMNVGGGGGASGAGGSAAVLGGYPPYTGNPQAAAAAAVAAGNNFYASAAYGYNGEGANNTNNYYSQNNSAPSDINYNSVAAQTSEHQARMRELVEDLPVKLTGFLAYPAKGNPFPFVKNSITATSLNQQRKNHANSNGAEDGSKEETHEWTIALSSRHGRYLFIPNDNFNKNKTSGGSGGSASEDPKKGDTEEQGGANNNNNSNNNNNKNSGGGGQKPQFYNTHRHPQTHQIYKASPQAFALDRGLDASRLAFYAANALVLPPALAAAARERFAEEKKKKAMSNNNNNSTEKDMKEESEKASTAPAGDTSVVDENDRSYMLRTVEEVESWLSDQRVRDIVLDASVVQILAIKYDHQNDFGGLNNRRQHNHNHNNNNNRSGNNNRHSNNNDRSQRGGNADDRSNSEDDRRRHQRAASNNGNNNSHNGSSSRSRKRGREDSYGRDRDRDSSSTRGGAGRRGGRRHEDDRHDRHHRGGRRRH